MLPLVLAQLLIQFQKPIVVEQALAVNGSRPFVIDDALPQLSNDSTDGHRSARAIDGLFSIDDSENPIHSANLFAPDYSLGRCWCDEIARSSHIIFNFVLSLIRATCRNADGSGNKLGGLSVVDDVKNESIKNLYPQAVPKSDRHDELMLNLTRQDVYEFANHVWNDVYWLASLVIVMTFSGCLVSHHYDLRMRMVGAQMRIACCSLIYRKVG